jgi:type IV pilus assembly protein PilP
VETKNQELNKSMLTKKFIYNIYIIGICLFTTGLFITHSFAEEMTDTQEEQPEQQDMAVVSDNPQPDAFKYQLEGRPDPFEPFIRPQVATTVQPDEIIEEEKVLTGMQLFEPGQLTLVAVMFAKGDKIAMVEDVTGKGYILNEGVMIGRNGVVSRITEDQVIITETARTRAGKEIISTVVMRLNKEGD